MLDEGMRIELAARLRTLNRVLDCIVPDSPTETVDEAIEIVLKAVGRQEMTQAVTILEEVVGRTGGADQRACRTQSHSKPCRTTQTI
jgi:hypothetical protein